MYRQIKVAEKDQEYQYIQWRNDAKLAISEFQLTTVTYGTSAAPFLAVRCLRELADRLCQEDFFSMFCLFIESSLLLRNNKFSNLNLN